MAKSRTKWKCLDCGVDTGKIGEHYFVHTALWLQATNSIKGMLCVGCLETRLGRLLTRADFTEAYINRLQHGRKSVRLTARLMHHSANG